MQNALKRREFLTLLASAAVANIARSDERQIPPLLDHFILGCNDLDRGIAFVEQYTRVRAAFGGVHPGRGTRNALLSLGPRRYLEIMAPDPTQNVEPQIPRIRAFKEPRIVGWAAHVDDIEKVAGHLREQLLGFEPVREGSRERPDGKVLHWKSLTLTNGRNGLLPFFIEWSKDSVHPSTDAPPGCNLEYFGGVARDFDQMKHFLGRLQLEMPLTAGVAPRLRARISHAQNSLPLTSISVSDKFQP
jgi:glyoxalase-like protein